MKRIESKYERQCRIVMMSVVSMKIMMQEIYGELIRYVCDLKG